MPMYQFHTPTHLSETVTMRINIYPPQIRPEKSYFRVKDVTYLRLKTKLSSEAVISGAQYAYAPIKYTNPLIWNSNNAD